MNLDRKTTRYLKRKMNRGKNRVAGVIDLILGSLLLFIVLFFLFWRLHLGILPSTIFSATSVLIGNIALSAYNGYRFERFVTSELRRIKKQVMLERLTFLKKEAFLSICQDIFVTQLDDSNAEPAHGGFYFPDSACFCYGFDYHPGHPVSPQDILEVYRTAQSLGAGHMLIVSVAPYSTQAKVFSARMEIKTTLLEQERFFYPEPGYIDAPSEEDIKTALYAEMEAIPVRSEIRSSFISPGKTRSYLLCAAFLLSWYFITGISILYLIGGGICLLFAFLSHKTKRAAESSISQ